MIRQRGAFLVTGGSSGLGEAVVRRLAKNSAVVICDVNEERGFALQKELGENVRFHLTDVTSTEDVTGALDLANSAFGGVAGAVSCAGVGYAGKVLSKRGVHPLDAFEKTIRVNLLGSFNVVRLAAERMAAQDPFNDDGSRGVIVQTASIAAMDGQIGQAAYSASKGGVVGMTLPLARELASNGIRVMTIAPGLFDTPLLAALPEKAREALGRSVPHPARLGNPDEFAQLVEHVIDNGMMNGEVIRIDGSLRMA